MAPLVDAMLREDWTAPRKQQHTARRVLARLVDEHGVTHVSYWTVRDYVAKRRPQIAAEAGRVLEVLGHKPGALPGATALVQARAAGTFTAAHEAFWAPTRKAHGDGDGTRELVEVLLLHRHMRSVDVVDGLAAALAVGAVRADVVAVEARWVAQSRPVLEETPGSVATSETGLRVVSLTERRLADPAAVIAGLPADSRPLPSVTAYDELLARRPILDGPGTSAAAAESKGHVS